MGGMCWTMRTAAPRPVGSEGTRSARARGPPVEAAIATARRARGRNPGSGAWRTGTGGRASTETREISAARAARTASWSRGARPRSASLVAFSGLATISTAPSSRARIAAAVPGPACALTTTIGRGDSDMMYPMAPRPSSSGISRSIVTTSGSNWWTLRTASNPSRALATTRNGPSPPVPPSTSARTRRISALSSTTRTVGLPSDDFDFTAHRADLDAAVDEVEADRPTLTAADRFALDRDRRHAQGVARRDDIALAHLQGARGHQGGEHRGAAGELGVEAAAIRTERDEALDEERDRRLREFRGVLGVARQALGRQQDVGHGAGPGPGIVEHDRHARAQPQRDDDGVGAVRRPVGDLHDPLPRRRGGSRTHAGLR